MKQMRSASQRLELSDYRKAIIAEYNSSDDGTGDGWDYRDCFRLPRTHNVAKRPSHARRHSQCSA